MDEKVTIVSLLVLFWQYFLLVDIHIRSILKIKPNGRTNIK
jgi:hypothetical protein